MRINEDSTSYYNHQHKWGFYSQTLVFCPTDSVMSLIVVWNNLYRGYLLRLSVLYWVRQDSFVLWTRCFGTPTELSSIQALLSKIMSTAAVVNMATGSSASLTDTEAGDKKFHTNGESMIRCIYDQSAVDNYHYSTGQIAIHSNLHTAFFSAGVERLKRSVSIIYCFLSQSKVTFSGIGELRT